MDHFNAVNGVLHCENVALPDLAEETGTPVYVYSRATLQRHCDNFRAAFKRWPTLPCYAVKANSNLSVLSTIFKSGFGADLVSLGELERALLARADPATIVFSGVGKREDEILRGLQTKILSFNVESSYELDALETCARAMGRRAPVSLRLNPNIDAKTNEKIATGLYTTKFGLTEGELSSLLDRIKSSDALELVGIACHIGSQITEIGPMRDAAQRMAKLAHDVKAAGFQLKIINMGGGLGIRYRDETPPSLESYADTIIEAIKPTGLKLVVEPGRVIVGNTGVLLTKVIGVKKTPAKHFVVLDAAMNDLVRPSLYGSYHEVEAVDPKHGASGAPVLCDFVGPICETGDIIGKDRKTPAPHQGALYAVRGAGAYGSSMASHYNSRPRAAEVMVDGDGWRVIRPRESLASLWETELSALE